MSVLCLLSFEICKNSKNIDPPVILLGNEWIKVWWIFIGTRRVFADPGWNSGSTRGDFTGWIGDSGLKELWTPGAKQQAVRKMDGLLTVPPMEQSQRLFYHLPRRPTVRNVF